MPLYRVVNPYVDGATRERRRRGETVNVSKARGDRLVARRLAVPVDRSTEVETATQRPAETTARRVTAPKHIGGGWYELPDGERVQGRAAAEKRMNE